MSEPAAAPLEAVVDGFTHGGEGVVRIDGKATFVAGALPGERIRLEVVDDRRRWARGRLVEVLEPAPERVEPPCGLADVCGGCDLQHVSPAGQLELKTRVVREQLERIGRLVDPPVAEAVGVGPALRYRNVARMHAAPDGRLGFHRTGTNDVVPVPTCPVLAPEVQAVRDAVGDSTGAAEVTLRATATGDRGVVLGQGHDPVEESARWLGEEVGVLTVAVARPDGTIEPIHGDGTVVEQVPGFDFTVDVDGFFQGNTAGAEALVAAVLEVLDDVDGRTAWDLYAGVGLFTLPLAQAGASVTAVEGVASAVDHLRANAARAGLADRVTGVAEDVRRFVTRSHAGSPDVVVLDPPRTGAGKEVVAAIAGLAPDEVVYVACDPAALARDARVLAELGYRPVSVQPFDLFPMTHHIEAVAHFA